MAEEKPISIHEFNLTDFQDADGNITEEGRAKLQARIMDAVEGQLDPSERAEAAKKLAEALAEKFGTTQRSIDHVIGVAAMIEMLRRLESRIESMRPVVLKLAQGSGNTASKVYDYGQINAHLQIAQASLAEARDMLDTMQRCECPVCKPPSQPEGKAN